MLSIGLAWLAYIPQPYYACETTPLSIDTIALHHHTELEYTLTDTMHYTDTVHYIIRTVTETHRVRDQTQTGGGSEAHLFLQIEPGGGTVRGTLLFLPRIRSGAGRGRGELAASQRVNQDWHQ